MNKKHLGKRILIGMLSLAMAGSAFVTNAYADEVEAEVSGVAAEMLEITEDETASAPIEAAETLALAALELSAMDETAPEVSETETEAAVLEEAFFEPVPESFVEEMEEAVQEIVPEETVPEETGEHPAILAAEARLAAMAHTVYDDIAVARVDSAVNIRKKPSADAELVGKIYNNCAANIIDTVEAEDGEWYKIQSGGVEGYIKAKYFITGEAAKELAMEIGCVNATITTPSLRLRESADLGSATVTVLTKDETYTVEEQGPEFSKLSIDDELCGFVQNDYLHFEVAFKEAVSIEEIIAQEEEQARLEREAEEARQRLLEEQAREAAEAEEEEEEDYEDEPEYEPETEPETSPSIETEEEPEEEPEETTTEAEEEPETTTTEEEPETTTVKETEEETTKAKEKETTKAKEEETTKAKEKETTKAKEEETTKAKEKETTKAKEKETTKSTEKETTKAKEKETTKASEKETEEEEEDRDTSALREAIVAEALSYVGKLQYVYGGNSLVTGTDCSGFTKLIYAKFGITLPRRSADQQYSGKAVSSSKMRPGDIIYYGGHVAIYIGNGKIVHAANRELDVKISRWNYRSAVTIRNVIGD